jgi:valyl-tRNA synthetase
LATTIAEAREAIDGYRFNDYANVLYQFTWHEFCDWYIEMSKLALNGDDAEQARQSRTLLRVLLEQILLLLHPIMPFVTEEIWQALGESRPSIMVQPYPRFDAAWADDAIEKQMEFLMGVVRAIRNLRSEMNCPPGKQVKAIFRGSEQELSLLRAQEPYLRSLARVGSAEYSSGDDRPEGVATAVVGTAEISLPLGDLVNLAEERARLTKEIRKFGEEFARVQKKLTNSDFISKAKEEVVQKEREKAGQYEEKIRTLNQSLARIEKAQSERS